MMGLGVGLAALAILVAVERRQAEPMLDLALFRDRRLVGGIWAMLAYAACAQVMASLLPLLLQNGVGHAPVAAGLAMLPFGVAMFVFPHVGRALGRRLAPPRSSSSGFSSSRSAMLWRAGARGSARSRRCSPGWR